MHRFLFSENDKHSEPRAGAEDCTREHGSAQNDGSLPLKASVKKIAIVGPLADSIRRWRAITRHLVALRHAFGRPSQQFASTEVTYTPGTKFLRNPITIPASEYHNEDGKPGITATYFTTKTSPAPRPRLVSKRRSDFQDPG